MAAYTQNYNLKKPAETDSYTVDDFNSNADKIDAALNGFKSVVINHTIPNAGWNNGVYTFTSDKIKSASQIIELAPSADITKAEMEAGQAANIVGKSQAVGSIMLECFGDVPSIDIPVQFVIRGDA